MSRVTNVILTAHVGLQDGSDPEIDSVNKFLREADGGGYCEFVDVSEQAGGKKYIQIHLLIEPFGPLTNSGFQDLGQPFCAMPRDICRPALRRERARCSP